LRADRDARRVRARDMLTRTAGFPVLKTLDGYDFAFATGTPRQQFQELATLGFVERAENVVLLGPSGTGKTQVSTAMPGLMPRGSQRRSRLRRGDRGSMVPTRTTPVRVRRP
jgi:ABC-type glutathione transport system ATPase component